MTFWTKSSFWAQNPKAIQHTAIGTSIGLSRTHQSLDLIFCTQLKASDTMLLEKIEVLLELSAHFYRILTKIPSKTGFFRLFLKSVPKTYENPRRTVSNSFTWLNTTQGMFCKGKAYPFLEKTPTFGLLWDSLGHVLNFDLMFCMQLDVSDTMPPKKNQSLFAAFYSFLRNFDQNSRGKPGSLAYFLNKFPKPMRTF